ncbi:hypothetical protein BpHYR1_041929 [Brachionus plicatilis]|uniref:DOMON domain-containing protein n=1 Tax=Brachionus plicatilis TaxID=10195 RepID=A0A3M7QNU4_BRAPC|nr:hypothetical protein BpHYR1_041929 [Brachionus plicatilis]
MRTEIIVALLFANFCYGQNFRPSGSMSLVNSHVTWTNNGMATEFTVTSDFNGEIDPSNAWISLGVNSAPQMSGTNAVVCVNTASGSSVAHHINRGYQSPLFDSSRPSLGLNNTKLDVVNRNLTCSFTREKFFNVSGYFGFDSMTSLHILVAYGQGTFSYHRNRGSSMNRITFSNGSMNYTNPFPQMTTPGTPSNNLFSFVSQWKTFMLSLPNEKIHLQTNNY